MEPRPDEYRVVARRFKQLRRRALVTQSNLGIIIGVSRSCVNSIETQRTLPNTRTWAAFHSLESLHKAGKKVRLPLHWR